jgi:ketosteroid isomerase-like protein
MKHILIATMLLLIVTSFVSGQAPEQKTSATTSEENAVREVEDKFAAAYSHNDAEALDALWAADYIFVNPAGQVLTKAQRLTMLRSGELKIESYSRDDESIRVYGNTAVVTYRSHVKAQRNGHDISSARRVITVLVKRDSRWQAVAQQSTTILER